MKNIIAIAQPKDIHEYVYNLWSDGPIKQSHLYKGLVHDIVHKFAQTPRIFFEASDDNLEWTHFSTWWGAILKCEYENPTIRDLRYLHEIFHGATIPYQNNLTVEQMEERNFLNEKLASTFTEMAVYLEFPELRKLTFDHPILMDKYLHDIGLQERWHKDRWDTILELMLLRSKASEIQSKDDPQIIWLERYRQQEIEWVKIWSDRHQQVDNAMIALSMSDNKEDALKTHLEWLNSVSENNIPFYNEAKLFRNAFDSLLVEYNESMARLNQKPMRHG